MHHFYFVTFSKGCRGPIRPSDYTAVDFNGQALGFEAERVDQVGKTAAPGKFGLLPV
jgi:hypothetical protein